MNKVFKIKPKADSSEVHKKLMHGLDVDSKRRLWNAIYDDGYWDQVKDLRTEYSKTTEGFSKGRTRRHIASIPYELYHRAKQLYGKDVFTNKKKFKELFLKDEVGEWTLVVPKNTI